MDSLLHEYDRKSRGLEWIVVAAIGFLFTLMAVNILARPGHYRSVRPNRPEVIQPVSQPAQPAAAVTPPTGMVQPR